MTTTRQRTMVTQLHITYQYSRPGNSTVYLCPRAPCGRGRAVRRVARRRAGAVHQGCILPFCIQYYKRNIAKAKTTFCLYSTHVVLALQAGIQDAACNTNRVQLCLQTQLLFSRAGMSAMCGKPEHRPVYSSVDVTR